MTGKTRYFVIASLLVLTIGLGTGLVAYYVGLPTGAFSRLSDPAELQLIPRTASLVAYADVHEIMISDLREKARQLLPMREDGQKEFQTATGINLETDVDHIVAGIVPQQGASGIAAGTGNAAGRGDNVSPFGGVVLVRGRFEDAKIEALMQEHGAQVEEYRGTRLLVSPTPRPNATLSLAFLEPGLVAVGSSDMVRTAVDLKAGGENVTANGELMSRVRDQDGTAWAVGRFDTLAEHGRLPAAFATQIPPITWFSASTFIDSGIRGLVRVDARDEEAANNLREVVRGFVALARLQSSSQPALKTAVDSLSIQGTGTTVTLSFDLPAEAIDALGSTVHR